MPTRFRWTAIPNLFEKVITSFWCLVSRWTIWARNLQISTCQQKFSSRIERSGHFPVLLGLNGFSVLLPYLSILCTHGYLNHLVFRRFGKCAVEQLTVLCCSTKENDYSLEIWKKVIDMFIYFQPNRRMLVTICSFDSMQVMIMSSLKRWMRLKTKTWIARRSPPTMLR